MSDLPVPVAEAGLLFRRPAIANDPDAMRQLKQWGYQQIDSTYPEDPIRAPLNVMRRLRARREWDRVVATLGRDLRGTITNQMVRDLEFEFKRRQDDILAQDAEDRRRGAVTFDGTLRVKEYEATSQINLSNEKDRMRLGHKLNEEAEDNASRRRIRERSAETEGQIAVLIAAAITKTMGTGSAEKTIEATRLVNAEISKIRSSPDLTDDDKHLQIQTLLATLPQLLRNIWPHDD